MSNIKIDNSVKNNNVPTFSNIRMNNKVNYKLPVLTVGLNLKMPGNYVFYDTRTGMHLTLTRPVSETNIITQSMKNGFTAGTLIDVNHVLDKNFEFKIEKKPQEDNTSSVEPALSVNNANDVADDNTSKNTKKGKSK